MISQQKYETIENMRGVMISQKKAVRIIKEHGCLNDLNDFWFNYGINKKYDAYDVYSWLGY